MRPAALAALTLSAVAVITPAHAQEPGAHDLSGLACLRLNLAPQQWQRGFMAPLHARPDAASPQVGTVGGRFLAPAPVQAAGGFVLVMRADGSTGWLQEDYARPYTAGPCRPQQLANGRVGY